ncbi:HlyD family efflux transporter periplasmic adaptor subunit [Alteraurantiacibacter buctensis]|uniref:HlyD family efflux transporter periplasmic adaptor subunit n=1 Tax=Alteraurantiacibacter buctensis TaxID=1503981 RepID=A0A844Z181_9SPHN|nr:HlyD family efflux transporter periplasmic adaptor subunit [Alteraurantiacibacter buctensis]MXO73272.1 HlyD family efflux transporter periplasmic adaptor subunit [Alteraurantiacibacter buctensis]
MDSVQPPAPAGAEVEVEGAAPKVDRRGKLFRILGLVVLAAAIGWGAYYWFFQRGFVGTDNAYVAAESAVVTPRLAAAVREVRVADTQVVKAGDVLVVLDDADARVELAAAEAALRQAQQRFSQARANDRQLGARVAGASADIAAAQARLVSAEADLARANDAVSRRSGLAESGAVAGEELSQARATQAQARAAVDAARAALASAQANRAAASGSADANAVITRVGDMAGDPDVRAAQARVDAARLMLERTVIRAPVAGTVAQRTVQPGQQVAPGTPLLHVVPLAQAFVEANFRETQLGPVRVGQPVELTSDFHGSDVVYHGRVSGIGAASGAASSLIPAQNASGNWVKVVQRIPVRIALDARELAAHPLPVGASMEAEIDTRGN